MSDGTGISAVGDLRALARTVHGAADTVEAAATTVAALQGDWWEGPAATLAAARIDERVVALRGIGRRLSELASTAATLAAQLEAAS